MKKLFVIASLLGFLGTKASAMTYTGTTYGGGGPQILILNSDPQMGYWIVTCGGNQNEKCVTFMVTSPSQTGPIAGDATTVTAFGPNDTPVHTWEGGWVSYTEGVNEGNEPIVSFELSDWHEYDN